MAYPNARLLSLAALALCPAAAGFQDPDLARDRQFTETFLPDSTDATIHGMEPGLFLSNAGSLPGGLALVSPDPVGSDMFVYHMDRVAQWKAFYKVSDTAAFGMGVLPGQGAGGLDAIVILHASGLQAYGPNGTQDGFVGGATLPSWGGLSKIWVGQDSSGGNTIFGLDPALGLMHRASYDAASSSFLQLGSFPCPNSVENLVSLEYDTGVAGHELAMLGTSGILTIHPWDGLSTLQTLTPYGANPNAGAISVIHGDGVEQDLLMWRYQANSAKTWIRAFNARDSSRPFSIPFGSWEVGPITSADWDGDGDKDWLIALSPLPLTQTPDAYTILVAERVASAPHAWGTIRYSRSLSPTDSIDLFHANQDPTAVQAYDFEPPTHIIAGDIDLDGDLDLQIAGAREGGLQVWKSDFAGPNRPESKIHLGTTFVNTPAGSDPVVFTTVETTLPTNWQSDPVQPTHLRLKFWNRVNPTDPWDDDRATFHFPLPTNGDMVMSTPIQFDPDWVAGVSGNNPSFAMLIHSDLVALDGGGTVLGAMPTASTIYARGPANADAVLEKSLQTFEASSEIGGGTGSSSDTTSENGRGDSSGTPPDDD